MIHINATKPSDSFAANLKLSRARSERVYAGSGDWICIRSWRFFLVTSRHVVIDQPSGHLPDRVEIELHTDADNIAMSTVFSIPLYRDGEAVWRQGIDAGGQIDVAAVEIERAALPATIVYRA